MSFVHPSDNNHEPALIVRGQCLLKFQRPQVTETWPDKSVRIQTFLQNFANRPPPPRIFQARQSRKCLQLEVNLLRILPRLKTFDIILFPRQAAAVLPRKLLNNSSPEALTGSGVREEKEISEFIDAGACTMHSKCSSSAPQEI